MHTLVRRTEARRHDLTRQQTHAGRQLGIEQGGAGAKLRQRVVAVAQRKAGQLDARRVLLGNHRIVLAEPAVHDAAVVDAVEVTLHQPECLSAALLNAKNGRRHDTLSVLWLQRPAKGEVERRLFLRARRAQVPLERVAGEVHVAQHRAGQAGALPFVRGNVARRGAPILAQHGRRPERRQRAGQQHTRRTPRQPRRRTPPPRRHNRPARRRP